VLAAADTKREFRIRLFGLALIRCLAVERFTVAVLQVLELLALSRPHFMFQEAVRLDIQQAEPQR
jgi:hypothetical protein